MDDRELYKEKAQAKLDALNARIDLLKAQAADKKADAGLKTNKELEHLRERREDLHTHMAKLQESSAEAWEEVRMGFDRALADVQNAMERAGDKLSER